MDLEEAAEHHRMPLRILITRLRYLGDVILTTPAVTAVKSRYPHAEIHYLAEHPYAEILEGHPDLTDVISLRRGWGSAAETLLAIRRRRFTAAVDLFYNPRSALMLFLSHIPIRVGGSRRARRRLYTNIFTVPPGATSAVAHHLAALDAIDVRAEVSLPRIYLRAEEMEAGRRVVADAVGGCDGGRPVIAFHPGGTWPAKRWPAASFAELAAMVAGRLRAKVLIVTGPGEEETAHEVEQGMTGEVHLLPLQPLRTVAGVLSACRAVVANDGGILHMAVALGRPTVGIFGPTEPHIWFPYEGKGPFALATRRADCAPCHKHFCDDMRCLKDIGPAEVLSRLETVLAWRDSR